MDGLVHPRPPAVPCLTGGAPRHDFLNLKLHSCRDQVFLPHGATLQDLLLAARRLVHASTEPRSPPSSTFPPSRCPWLRPLPLRALLSCIEQQERAPPRVHPRLGCYQRAQGPAGLLSQTACPVSSPLVELKPMVRQPSAQQIQPMSFFPEQICLISSVK